MVKQKKKRKIDLLFITACISTSLVLLLIGIVALLLLTANDLSLHMRFVSFRSSYSLDFGTAFIISSASFIACSVSPLAALIIIPMFPSQDDAISVSFSRGISGKKTDVYPTAS